MGNILKDASADNMKKTELNEKICDVSVYYDCTDVDNNLDIHKFLMVKNNIKWQYSIW